MKRALALRKPREQRGKRGVEKPPVTAEEIRQVVGSRKPKYLEAPELPPKLTRKERKQWARVFDKNGG